MDGRHGEFRGVGYRVMRCVEEREAGEESSGQESRGRHGWQARHDANWRGESWRGW